MISSPCSAQSEPWVAGCGLFVALIPCAIVGLALMNAGFTRTRSVAQILFASVSAMGAAALAYMSLGFVWQSTPCLHGGRDILMHGRSWGLLGSGPFFLRGVDSGAAETILFLLFGLGSVSFCSLIPLSSAAERFRLGPALVSAAVMSAFLFPIFGHWSWPGGWLAQSGLIDVGGSGFIHAFGGLNALAIVWLTGPRRGKFSAAGMPAATPGHNAPFILGGCLLSLVGWFGINSAGALLLAGTDMRHIPSVLLNTLAGAVGGFFSAAFLTRVRFGKPDASLCANGWVAGLVATSAACTSVPVPEAILIGLIAGTLAIFFIEILEMRLKIDDPSGAISVHAIGGLWGLLAAGLFSGLGQTAAQICGISILLGFVFPLAYGINYTIDRFLPYRATPEGERQGMDLHELGAGAYPEFVVHREDFNLR